MKLEFSFSKDKAKVCIIWTWTFSVSHSASYLPLYAEMEAQKVVDSIFVFQKASTEG